MIPRTALDLSGRMLDALANQPSRLAGFLQTTGMEPGALRQGLDGSGIPTPDLALAILDYVMGDEALLLTLCADLTVSPDMPARALAALGGGPGPHWT